MESSEWCALAHIDIGSRNGLEEVEQLLSDVVLDLPDDVIGFAGLRTEDRPNHFELIGRYRSEAAYIEHLTRPSKLAFRRGIKPRLASPYEDRLHKPRGPQTWPEATKGDCVVITRVEVRPGRLQEALPFVDELIATRLAAQGLAGQAVLERRDRPYVAEIISVWASSEAFTEHVAAEPEQSSHAALGPLLLAPVSDREYSFIVGEPPGP